MAAQIKAFPQANSSLKPLGSVLLSFSIDGIEIEMNVSGLDSLCMPSNVNGCGIHIHEGVSCESSDKVKGHYWSNNVLGNGDPWANITYTTNEAGLSGGSVILAGGNGYSADENDGHSIVIHDLNGTKIGCGILEKSISGGSENVSVASSVSQQETMTGEADNSMLSAQIDTFPRTNSSLNPNGDLSVMFSDDIKMKMNVSGLESLCAPTNTNGCGIHIHEGVSCNSNDQVMGHYWNISALGELDPWVNVTYTTNKGGVSGASVVLMGGNGYSMEENVGHAIVIHGQDGEKIACGILMKSRTRRQAQTIL